MLDSQSSSYSDLPSPTAAPHRCSHISRTKLILCGVAVVLVASTFIFFFSDTTTTSPPNSFDSSPPDDSGSGDITVVSKFARPVGVLGASRFQSQRVGVRPLTQSVGARPLQQSVGVRPLGSTRLFASDNDESEIEPEILPGNIEDEAPYSLERNSVQVNEELPSDVNPGYNTGSFIPDNAQFVFERDIDRFFRGIPVEFLIFDDDLRTHVVYDKRLVLSLRSRSDFKKTANTVNRWLRLLFRVKNLKLSFNENSPKKDVLQVQGSLTLVSRMPLSSVRSHVTAVGFCEFNEKGVVTDLTVTEISIDPPLPFAPLSILKKLGVSFLDAPCPDFMCELLNSDSSFPNPRKSLEMETESFALNKDSAKKAFGFLRSQSDSCWRNNEEAVKACGGQGSEFGTTAEAVDKACNTTATNEQATKKRLAACDQKSAYPWWMLVAATPDDDKSTDTPDHEVDEEAMATNIEQTVLQTADSLSHVVLYMQYMSRILARGGDHKTCDNNDQCEQASRDNPRIGDTCCEIGPVKMCCYDDENPFKSEISDRHYWGLFRMLPRRNGKPSGL